MRKPVSALIIIFCLASPAFSQIRMSGWGRTVFVPFLLDQDEELRSVVHAPWGEEPDLEFYINGVSPNVGVDVGILVEKGSVEKGLFNQIANAKVWWSPNRYFKLHIGAGRVQDLRGKMYSSSGAYAYARGRHTGISSQAGDNEPIVKIDDGDGIFSRFNLSRLGAIAELTPMPGLYIGAAVMPEYNGDKGNLTKDTLQGIHAAAGYDIRGIGFARVGYIGGGRGNDGIIANSSRNNDFSLDKRIEAAFYTTLIPYVAMDFGLKYSLEEHPGTLLDRTGFSLENPLYLALGLMYTGVENLRLGFAMDGHFAGTAKAHIHSIISRDPITSAPQIAFNIFPVYDIGYCDIGGDFTYGVQMGDEKGINDKQILGFGVFAQKNYSNGNFRMGIYANAPMDDGQKWGMAVPIWITYSF